MLLIDADNVSVDVIEQAVARVLAEHGAHPRAARLLHGRVGASSTRSCSSACRSGRWSTWRRGKNSTDIALAVDAIDLVLAERPDVVVIVVVGLRLRAAGDPPAREGLPRRGIGQQGKTGDDSKPVYDGFVDLLHQKKPEAAPRAPRKRAAARRARRRRLRPSAPAAPALPDDVQRILAAIPELRGGEKLELRIAAERLRAEGLLTKNAPSTKLFKKYIDFFALTPERQPNKVQYRGR